MRKEEIYAFFAERMPEIQLEKPEWEPGYEKAFLTPEEAQDSEYAENTSAWD